MTTTGSGGVEVGTQAVTSPSSNHADEQQQQSSTSSQTLTSLPWQESGYLSWEYDGHNINYVDEGDKDKVGM